MAMDPNDTQENKLIWRFSKGESESVFGRFCEVEHDTTGGGGETPFGKLLHWQWERSQLPILKQN